MPPIYQNWCNVQSRTLAAGRSLHLVTEQPGARAGVLPQIVQTVQSHYDAPAAIADCIRRLGMARAARKLAQRMPQTIKGRSGHLGEILATEVVPTVLPQFQVPINRLRWNDGRDTSMRGEDVVGITPLTGGNARFLKGESKSRRQLGNTALRDARKALNANRGTISAHALAFIESRLREAGNTALADYFERYQLDRGMTEAEVTHLNFTFTGNNAATLIETELRGYRGRIEQHCVNLRITDHQAFIVSVYPR